MFEVTAKIRPSSLKVKPIRYMKASSATRQRGVRTLGAHRIKYVREKR